MEGDWTFCCQRREEKNMGGIRVIQKAVKNKIHCRGTQVKENTQGTIIGKEENSWGEEKGGTEDRGVWSTIRSITG